MLELSNIGDTGQGWTPGRSGACTGHSTLPDAARNTADTGEATEDWASIYRDSYRDIRHAYASNEDNNDDVHS